MKNERAAGRLGIQSSNYYLGCIKSFLAWMVKDGRTDRNPLAHMSGMNAKVDVRRERRSLSLDEQNSIKVWAQRYVTLSRVYLERAAETG